MERMKCLHYSEQNDNHLSDTLRLQFGIRYADEKRMLILRSNIFTWYYGSPTLAAMIPGVEEGDAVPRQLTACTMEI